MLMNELVGIEDISLSNPFEGEDGQVDFVASKTRKWARRRNFSPNKDKVLVMAWEICEH